MTWKPRREGHDWRRVSGESPVMYRCARRGCGWRVQLVDGGLNVDYRHVNGFGRAYIGRLDPVDMACEGLGAPPKVYVRRGRQWTWAAWEDGREVGSGAARSRKAALRMGRAFARGWVRR